MLDPLGCLGAAASLDRAKAVMADCFHLNARARETVAGKVKEQIVGWLRGKKRGSDTPAGSDSKRMKLDTAAGGGKSGGKAGAAAAEAGTSRKGDGKVRSKPSGKGSK
jgi:hypothetical protein